MSDSIWETVGFVILILLLLILLGVFNSKSESYPIAYAYYANKGEILNGTIVCSKFNFVAVNSTLTPSIDVRLYAYCYNDTGKIIRIAVTSS